MLLDLLSAFQPTSGTAELSGTGTLTATATTFTPYPAGDDHPYPSRQTRVSAGRANLTAVGVLRAAGLAVKKNHRATAALAGVGRMSAHPIEHHAAAAAFVGVTSCYVIDFAADDEAVLLLLATGA